MTDTLNWEMRMVLTGGPSVEASDHLEIEAYEKVEAEIPEGSAPTILNVQPSLLTELRAIIITADVYEDLTFVVDEDLMPHTLDGPLMLVGPGNIAMLGGLGGTVNDIIFTNANVTTARNVTILVARDAITGPGT